jgi:hypothetical protein
MMLSVYQMLLSDKEKDKSNTGHSTTRSRLSSLREVPLKHMDWYYIYMQAHKYEYTIAAF